MHPASPASRRTPTRLAIAIAGAFTLVLALVGGAALASHGNAELPGSNFEIDDDANLVNDDGGDAVDWADLAHPDGPELRATDKDTGQTDDSYVGGVKEDTECPGEKTGSIPNNKSDLLTFHVYEESGSPGFLNLAWSRVSDPSGTTVMDFEFNQSTEPCPDETNSPNVVRTDGDLLIEYLIDQGGARAEIAGRFWDATAGQWGPSLDLDVPSADCDGNPCAVGTINSSVISANDSDGLGEKQERTFGEAQIDLDLIFDDNKCASFGSAMLKSRSSDQFNSQPKDFIAPIPIDLQNCGNVIIRKQTLPDEDPNTTDFGFTKAFNTDPSTGNTFTLKDDGVKDFQDDVLFGTGYTVTESSQGAGYQYDSVDCSASQNVTPTISNGGDGPLVTFDIDSDTDVLDCTYYNKALAKLTFVKDAERAGVDFDYTTSGGLTPSTFDLADGESQVYSDLSPGTYGATETVPDGWNRVSQDCDNNDTADAVTLAAGDDVTCTFVNEIERGAIKIVKTRKHAAADGGSGPHEGVKFTVTNAINGTSTEVTTNAQGEVCLGNLPVSTLDGDYTVTETLPDDYVADGPLAKTVTVSEGTCGGTPNEVTFSNTPLTDVTVSVDSLVDGGTSSKIECWDGAIDGDPEYTTTPPWTNPLAPDNGDGSLTVEDLLPTYPDDQTSPTITCEITVDP